ncbi:MAG: YicC/YloC family endoribonuclease [Planctomycetota bacterium]|jgi:uncharacterized protein (TIGR00255 family)
MIRSMTGFGDASAREDGVQYIVEIRSLNNKYFKAVIRLPEELQGLEAELETAIARRLARGSVVLTVRFSDTSAEAAATINTNAVQRYLDQMLNIEGLDHDAARVDLGALLSLPGVVITEDIQRRLDKARPVLERLINDACDKVTTMRTREGETLHRELHKHCQHIAEHLGVIEALVPQTVQQYQERLRLRMEALLAESGGTVREEDLLREVAVFAERSDTAEEVARLEGHLAQFGEIIDADREEPVGRTLDFLSQEMLREANTIASKCLDVEISRRIVEIKGLIDRIKEQAQNVE